MNTTRHFPLLLLSLYLAAPALQAETRERNSVAYQKGTDTVLYTETHVEQFVDSKIFQSEVIYRNRAGETFARKSVDYSRSRYLPEFTLKNEPSGHQELTRHVAESYEVTYRNAAKKESGKATLNPADIAIADAGFDQFILDNWPKLINKETLYADFLIPSMQQFVRFRIFQQRKLTNAEDLVPIRVEADSFLVRMFAEPIELLYRTEKNNPILYQFIGVSNLRDENGDNYQVRIEFDQDNGLITADASD